MSLCPEQTASPALDHVLAQLKGVRTSLRGWRACCPAHTDSEPSLSIGQGEQGQVLLKCFAGCSLERIVEAMGLTILDLFPDGATPAEQGSSNGTHHKALTLLDLAVEKQLPWKFLFHLGVMDHASGGGYSHGIWWINPPALYRPTSGLFLVKRQSRQAFFPQREAPYECSCWHMHQSPRNMTMRPHLA